MNNVFSGFMFKNRVGINYGRFFTTVFLQKISLSQPLVERKLLVFYINKMLRSLTKYGFGA